MQRSSSFRSQFRSHIRSQFRSQSGVGAGSPGGAGRRRSGLLLGLALLALAAAPAGAQSDRDPAPSPASSEGEAGPFSVRAGLGFSVDPTDFVLGFEGDYAFTKHVSAGLLVELGLDDDLIFVSPVGYGRYRFDLDAVTESQALRRLHPFVQGGLGFTHFNEDISRAQRRRGVDDVDTAFLMNLGFGVEFEIDPHVSVVSQMLFNIIPGEVLDERFYYSWQVLSVRYRF